MAIIPMAVSRVRTVENLRGSAGRLEALLNEGSVDARYAALVCHPHPMGGGTMHNKVVYHAMKVFQSVGLPVLRFNFRGTGLSEGQHDDGHGEQDDVRAAVDWLQNEFHLPLIFAGFSFGSAVGMKVCCGDSRVAGLVALGLPTNAEGRQYHYRFFPRCNQPKLFISGARDQYGPQDEVAAVVALTPEPRSLVFIPDADHFFAGKLDAMQTVLRTWLDSTFNFGGLESPQDTRTNGVDPS
jgi:hypothetical protein